MRSRRCRLCLNNIVDNASLYRPTVERNLELLPMPIAAPPVPPGPYRVRRMTVVHADGR